MKKAVFTAICEPTRDRNENRQSIIIALIRCEKPSSLSEFFHLSHFAGVQVAAYPFLHLGNIEGFGDVVVHTRPMPLLRKSARAWAVMAITGVPARSVPQKPCRIRRVASIPSISGISISMNTRS